MVTRRVIMLRRDGGLLDVVDRGQVPEFRTVDDEPF
jgi:hypothetical protein